MPTQAAVGPVGPCFHDAYWIHGLQATRRGWIAQTSSGLEAIDETGRSDWSVDNRSNCWSYYGEPNCAPRVIDFVATPDGGAWQLENNEFPDTGYRAQRLVRIRPDGSIGRTFDLAALTNFKGDEQAIASDGADGVALLWTHWAMGWGRVGQLRLSDSGPAVVSDFALAANDNPMIDDALVLDDGDVMFVFATNPHVRICINCYEHARLAVARASSTGVLRWRAESAVRPALQWAMSEEATWIGSDRFPLSLQRIASTGNVGVNFGHAGFGVDESNGLAAGRAGDLLLLTHSGLKRIDADGSTTGEVRWEASGTAYWRQPAAPFAAWPGVSNAVPDVLVLDPSSLAPSMRGFLDQRPSDGPVYPYVAALADGSVALLRSRSNSGTGWITELARFDIPGSVAADRLHRGGFEP